MKHMELYLSCLDYIENLNPEGPDELSDMIEEIMYTIQDVMFDYAEDEGWEQPEPFM